MSYFEGMHPDREAHTSRFEVEPNIGVPISLFSMIQVNIAVRTSPANTITKPLDAKVLPLLWISMLIPLYVCVGLGCGGAVFYLSRLALRSPDVTWNRKTNPEPWEEYRNKQYKFFSPTRDYSKEESPAPKF